MSNPPSAQAPAPAAAPRIPTVDLRPWLSGDADTRAAIARTVDEALQTAGFLLVTGHGVDPALRTGIRDAARAFFALPAEVKERYTAKVGGAGGWVRAPRPTGTRRGLRPRPI